MSPLNANLPTARQPVASANTNATRPVRATTDTLDKDVSSVAWCCLVLSADPARLEPLCEAVERAGWRALPSDSVGDAIRLSERLRTQLAVVDFAVMPDVHRETYRRFCQRIGSQERLLMVCDDEPTPSEELWARQNGVWIYLPSPELGGELIELFGEALQVAEKLSEGGLPAKAR